MRLIDMISLIEDGGLTIDSARLTSRIEENMSSDEAKEWAAKLIELVKTNLSNPRLEKVLADGIRSAGDPVKRVINNTYSELKYGDTH